MREVVMEQKYLNGKTEKQKWIDVAEVLYSPHYGFSKEFFKSILNDYFIILGGSIQSNVDNDSLVSLRNCYVIASPEDSYEGILKADAELVHLMKRRGGVGIDLSNIRPEGSPVNNAAKTSTGIVSFMNRYSNTTKEVAQGGRRGALMLTLDIRHPDADKFINAKTDLSKITGANISIKLTDEFMHAVKEDKEFIQQFPINSHKPLITKAIRAKELFDNIVSNIVSYAEPGILFWDTILNNRIDIVANEFKIKELKTVSTNPCGEIPLAAYDGCLLLHINYYKLVTNPFTPEAKVNTELAKTLAGLTVKIGNIIIEKEKERILSILNNVKGNIIETALWRNALKMLRFRRLGIGRTGVADFLAALNKPYKECDELALTIDLIHKEIERVSIEETTLYGDALDCVDRKCGRANIGLHTVAPVGTGSIMAGTTSGIEPLFSHITYRKKRATEQDKEFEVDSNGDRWVNYTVIHEPLREFAKINNLLDKPIDYIFKISPYYKNEAHNIDINDKLTLQALFQKYTDHSISITHNFVKGTTNNTVKEHILKAHALKVKGYTAYIEDSRTNILSVSKQSFDRPENLNAEIHALKYGNDTFYGIVGIDKGIPKELFIFKEKDFNIKKLTNPKIVKRSEEGENKYDLISDNIDILDIPSKYVNKDQTLLTKLISRALRADVPIKRVIKDFKTSPANIGSFQNAILALLEFYSGIKCPNCNSPTLAFQEGCLTCKACNYSKCS